MGTDMLSEAIAELRDVVRSLDHDPSPHAPEIPFTLREALEALFAADDVASVL